MVDLHLKPRKRIRIDGPSGESPPYGTGIDESERTLIKGATLQKPVRIGVLPAATVERVESGTLNLWVYGRVEYLDVFESVHTVGFCFRYERINRRMVSDRTEGYHYSD